MISKYDINWLFIFLLNTSCWQLTWSGLMGWLIWFIAPTLSQWQFSCNPVSIKCAWSVNPSVHWNAIGERIAGNQCVSSVQQVVFHRYSSVFQLCNLPLDCHWDTTGSYHCHWRTSGWYHQPMWFQSSLSSGFLVYWQYLIWRSAGQVTPQHTTPYVDNWYGVSCLSSADFIWTAAPNTQKNL